MKRTSIIVFLIASFFAVQNVDAQIEIKTVTVTGFGEASGFGFPGPNGENGFEGVENLAMQYAKDNAIQIAGSAITHYQNKGWKHVDSRFGRVWIYDYGDDDFFLNYRAKAYLILTFSRDPDDPESIGPEQLPH